MTPVHAHSDKSHLSVAKDFCDIGYYTHATERISSAFCGDMMMNQSRCILFGHAFPGPSFVMRAYCNKAYVLQAIAKEFNGLIAIGTFVDNKIPSNRKSISPRIVLKVKHRAGGAFGKYKARLVARGFLQKFGVDFFSTFSPMATLASIRMLLAIAANQGLGIIHAAIPQAFLKALLDTDIWLQLPPGTSFQDKNGKVLKVVKLIRSRYGLRDSPSNFNKELVRFMKAASVGQLESDKCIFYHIDKGTGNFVLVGCKVDDLIVTGNDASCIADLKKKTGGRLHGERSRAYCIVPRSQHFLRTNFRHSRHGC